MGGNLRAGQAPGRLQRTFALRALRAASASALALFAMLAWRTFEPSTPRAGQLDVSAAFSNALATPTSAVAAAEQRLSSHEAAQITAVGGRHQLLVRARATDGDGDPPASVALPSAGAELFGDAADTTRARLRRLALGHAPYGEPSPFDATAPPASSPRNG